MATPACTLNVGAAFCLSAGESTTSKPDTIPSPMARPSRLCSARLVACSLLRSSPERTRPLKKLTERVPPSDNGCCVPIEFIEPLPLLVMTDFYHQFQLAPMVMVYISAVALGDAQQDATSLETFKVDKHGFYTLVRAGHCVDNIGMLLF